MKTIVILMLGLCACDASYGGFLGAVPVADGHQEAPVQVYIGMDGVSRAAFEGARSRGAFSGWNDTDLIANFPAVSDYSWTRMLRTGTLHGYDLEYFDPEKNRLVNEGLQGVVEHPLRHGVLDPLPVYRKFDFMGDGTFWTVRGYSDPEASLPPVLDEMFYVIASRGRQQSALLTYLMNVDVVSHQGGLPRAIAMLIEIDRRITDFQERHPNRFEFTFFSDHGNAHQQAALVDPRVLLRQVGVQSTDALDPSNAQVHAVPVVHVRVNFVAMHTLKRDIVAVGERSSRHAWVDLSMAYLPDESDVGAHWRRFAIWRKGERFTFDRADDGTIRVTNPAAWTWLKAQWPLHAMSDQPTLTLESDAAFAATVSGQYPDLFARVATAFTDPSISTPADVLLSMPDDVTSFGFHLPGAGDHLAVDGFHGALTRGSSLGVLASQSHSFSGPVRADDLLETLPALQTKISATDKP